MNKLLTFGLIISIPILLLSGCKSTPAPEQEPTPAQTPSTEPEQITEPPTEPEPEAATEPAAGEGDLEDTPEPTMHNSGYIKFEGIDGESQSEGHEKWSEIESFRFEVARPVGGTTGISRESGKPALGDVTVVKLLDKSSVPLLNAACTSEVIDTVQIHLTGPSEASTCDSTFYICEMKNVMIIAYELNGSNPLAYSIMTPAIDVEIPPSGPYIVQAVDAPIEKLTLNCQEINIYYTECDSSGKTKGTLEYNLNLEDDED